MEDFCCVHFLLLKSERKGLCGTRCLTLLSRGLSVPALLVWKTRAWKESGDPEIEDAIGAEDLGSWGKFIGVQGSMRLLWCMGYRFWPLHILPAGVVRGIISLRYEIRGELYERHICDYFMVFDRVEVGWVTKRDLCDLPFAM
jgi:hypothetical protein